MRKLLAHVPVHVFEIGTAYCQALAVFRNDFHFKHHVVMALSLVSEVRQNRRILVRSRHAIRRQSVQRDDPRAHAGPKILSQKRAERNVLPFLDVTRGPIIEQRQAEDEVIRLGGADRLAHRLSTVGHERHLQFEVQQPRRAENRRRILVGTRLAGRTSNRRSAHHNARSAAVVSDRHVLPIGQQGIFWIPEHLAHIAGVVFTGIKVGVVAHLNRQVHGRVGLRYQHTRGVIRQFRGAGLQQFPQSAAHRSRGLFASANEGIERRRIKIRMLTAEVIKQAQGRNFGQIKDVLTNGHTRAGASVSCAENTKRQVLNGKVRVGRHVDPTGQIKVIHFKHVRKLRRVGRLTCQ